MGNEYAGSKIMEAFEELVGVAPKILAIIALPYDEKNKPLRLAVLPDGENFAEISHKDATALYTQLGLMQQIIGNYLLGLSATDHETKPNAKLSIVKDETP